MVTDLKEARTLFSPSTTPPFLFFFFFFSFSSLFVIFSSFSLSFLGMSAQPFQGIDSIIEVECSGRGLDSNTDLLIMTLFATNRDQIVASANLKKLECTTSQSFSMCIMDSKGHDTKVKTLVLDLAENEKRVYGCNVSVEVDRRGSIKSWSLEVGRQSES